MQSKLISNSQIEALAQQIAEKFQPQKIILFGSYAYGTPHSGSDIDLLIIMQFEGRGIDVAGVIWNAIRPRFPVDLIVKSSEEVAWRYQQYDPLVKMAIDYGRVLYDRSVARAEENWLVLELISNNPNLPNICCFHAQQCAEKMMKALLVQRQIPPDYTHNLLRIHEELIKAVPEWSADEVKLEKLTRFGVASRYPGLNAEPNDVIDCCSICAEIRSQALTILQSS